VVWLAQLTKQAIDAAIAADGGNAYRQNLGRVIPHIGDAYRSDESEYRSHLGASVIGGDCARAVAYGYRWAHKRPPRGKKGEDPVVAHSRMVRLWNRGHLEEARFIAMLLTAGIQVIQQDENGAQYRFSALGGHYSGSGDGFLLGVPDLPPGVPCLGEFKTHSEKSYDELVKKGVRLAKRTHYVQMQTYMGKFGLQYALYIAVNKNNDMFYCEIVMYEGETDKVYMERARRIIYDPGLPERLRNASPGLHTCKYMCDFPLVCFGTEKPDRNCRTCANGFAMPDGTWQCAPRNHTLSKEEQIAGCAAYTLSKDFA